MLAATHHGSGGVVWGIAIIVIGLVHLVFRRYYARRTAAVQRAKRDTAPGPFKRLTFGTSESTTLVWNTVVSGAFVVIGVVVLVVNLS
jgi:hypothetical protein